MIFDFLKMIKISTLILKRVDALYKYKNKKYFYNKDYIYCPEIELYLKIFSNGLRKYHKQNVFRGASFGEVHYTWKYFIDKFKIIDKYKKP